MSWLSSILKVGAEEAVENEAKLGAKTIAKESVGGKVVKDPDVFYDAQEPAFGPEDGGAGNRKGYYQGKTDMTYDQVEKAIKQSRPTGSKRLRMKQARKSAIEPVSCLRPSRTRRRIIG